MKDTVTAIFIGLTIALWFSGVLSVMFGEPLKAIACFLGAGVGFYAMESREAGEDVR